VTYVACTRARDLLVIPRAGSPGENLICGHLLSSEPKAAVMELEPYVEGKGAAWSAGLDATSVAPHGDAAPLEQEVMARWSSARDAAARTETRPVAVSTYTHGQEPELATEDVEATTARGGRYGPEFGTAVHRTIELSVRDPSRDVVLTAREVASQLGVSDKVEKVAADVQRAINTLKAEGLLDDGCTIRLEYPLCGPGDGGTLLLGSADFVTHKDGTVYVVDFKTDPPPKDAIETAYPAYVTQVRTYGQLLAGVGDKVRAGLLFTADGQVCWT
jgi:ATP-dependent helicase/nuclease subunit A